MIAQMGRPAPKLPNLRRPAPAAAPPEPAPAPAPRPARTRATRKAGRPPTGRTSKGIGLPVPLVEPMNVDAAARHQSLGDWLMGALGRVWDRLPEVYPALPARHPALPPPRRTPRGKIPGGRQPVNFRLTEPEVAAIAKRQAELGVESRSEFITTVIELDLQR